jgi:hypothetical protein
MRLWSDSFLDGGLIPGSCAFAVADPDSHVRLSSNRSPHLAWDEVPSGSQSLVLICHDEDAPTEGSRVNKEGVTVPEGLMRADFYHWSLVDLPVQVGSLPEGLFSHEVTPHGKPGPEATVQLGGHTLKLRHGINDYTGWFANDPGMAGNYYGYDGPCPPWNDERVHTYVFTLYALDIARLPLVGRFSGPDVRKAIHGHIIDEAHLVGVYSLYPPVAATLQA